MILQPWRLESEIGERFDPCERWLDNPGWLENVGDEILPCISHYNYRVYRGYMGYNKGYKGYNIKPVIIWGL